MNRVISNRVIGNWRLRHHAVFTVACPALEIVITPPHMQLSVQTLVKAGIPPTITVAEPGDQGATVLGMQGIGVRTPEAAVVAEATVGLANELHMTKGITLTMGILSIMLAAGTLLAFTRFAGKKTKEPGPAPKEQAAIAPVTTCWGIHSSKLRITNYVLRPSSLVL
jgi:hypothetical protein